MNNSSNQPSAADTAHSAGAPASAPITEAQVIAFLQAKASELAEKTAVGFATVEIVVMNPAYYAPDLPRWRAYVDGVLRSCEGATVDAVIAEVVAAMSPAARAELMRAKAKALLLEAEKLTPSPLVAV